MSWQAAVLDVALRIVVKRTLRADVPPGPVRKRLERNVRLFGSRPKGVTVTGATLAGVRGEWVEADGGAKAAAGGNGAILFLHGGAYCLGSPATHRPLTMRLAQQTGARVFVPHYRLAPEHPFPAALDDAVAVWHGLLAEGLSPGRIVIAGDSAGGGLAFATVLRLRDAGEPRPAGIVALSPWVDLAGTGESMIRNAAADPLLKAHLTAPAAALYTGGHPVEDPLVSPLYGRLEGLPPVLIHVGTTEILLDDSRRMAARLKDAGVPAILEVWPGMAHVWHLFAGRLPEADAAITRLAAFIRARLERQR